MRKGGGFDEHNGSNTAFGASKEIWELLDYKATKRIFKTKKKNYRITNILIH